MSLPFALARRKRRPPPTPPPQVGTGIFRGVAVAGGSFGDFNALPNTYGATGHVWDFDGAGLRNNTAGLQYLFNEGIRVVRLDFRWENLQPTLNAAFDSAELGRMTAMFNACKSVGLYFIPDCHNYGHRKTTQSGAQSGPSIGDAGVPLSAWQDFWRRFVSAFGPNDHLLGYEIMNEPVFMTGGATQSHAADQAAVAAIRETDTTRYIWVDGYQWAHVDNWPANNTVGGSTAPWIDDNDRVDATGAPLLRYAAHHYFDTDSDSDYADLPEPNVAGPGELTLSRMLRHLKEYTDWLDQYGVRGAITEVGWPDTTLWNQHAQQWFDACDAKDLDVLVWATGSAWSPSYALRAFGAGTSSNLDRQNWSLGDQIDITHGQGTVLKSRLPAAAKGLALPQGPTGSRWGPDATGPDGGRPATGYIDPASASFQAFTPFAQAADFYDSIGIAHYQYDGYEDPASRAAILATIQAMGIRNLRSALLMGNIYGGSYTHQQETQFWLIDCMNANDARSLVSGGPANDGVQPIYNSVHTNAERKWLVDNYGPRYSYELVDDDGGPGAMQIYATLEGPVGNVAAGTNTWGGFIYSRTKTLTAGATPIGWGAVNTFMGPNEPAGPRNPGYFEPGIDYGIRWGGREMMRAKNLRSGTSGPPWDYIDNSTGRITAGPIPVDKMVVIPFCSTAGANTAWAQIDGTATGGFYTDRTDSDVLSAHEYWEGSQAIWDYKFGTKAQQDSRDYNSGRAGTWGGRTAGNGSANPRSGGVRFEVSIPLVCTEMGHISRFDTSPSGPDGSWPHACPPEVAGEYIVQQLVQHYLQGYKRNYIFCLTEQDAALGYGLTTPAGVMKASGQIIRNLMALVGFKQGPAEGVQPISIPHTFTGGPDTFDTSATTGERLRDLVWKLVLRRSATEFIIILCRQRPLWGRKTFADVAAVSGVAAGITAARRTIAEDQARNVVLTLPSTNTWTCHVAEPGKNTITSANDGLLYGGQASPGDATDGRTYYAAGTSGIGFTQASNVLTVRMGCLTRVVRAVRS